MSYTINRDYILTNKVHKDSLNKYGHKYIVIHYFGALGTAKNTAKYFHDSTNRSSAHFCVDETKTVYQCVDLDNGAWHCGRTYDENKKTDGPCNLNSIGIEIRPGKLNTSSVSSEDLDWYFDPATWQRSIELVVDLMLKYDIDINHIVRHYDCTKKLCPSHMTRDKVMEYYKITGNNVWKKYLADIKTAYDRKVNGLYSYERGDVVYLNEDAEAEPLIEQLLENKHVYEVLGTEGNKLRVLTELLIDIDDLHLRDDQITIKEVTPYKVRVTHPTPYYTAPVSTAKIAGTIEDIPGIYTIVAESNNGYGRLKSGAGWLRLSDIEKI